MEEGAYVRDVVHPLDVLYHERQIRRANEIQALNNQFEVEPPPPLVPLDVLYHERPIRRANEMQATRNQFEVEPPSPLIEYDEIVIGNVD